MPIPSGFRVLFWDLDFDALDAHRDRETIVSRIAEHGTDEAVRWLRKTYTDEEIVRALEARRNGLSRRTLNLWALWLGKIGGLVRGDALTPAQRRFLETLRGSEAAEGFYLAGGSGLSLTLRHGRSNDHTSSGGSRSCRPCFASGSWTCTEPRNPCNSPRAR